MPVSSYNPIQDMIVTTGDNPSPAVIARAEEFAYTHKLKYAPRGRLSIARLAEVHEAVDVLVILHEAVRLIRPGRTPMSFHPSMGLIRAKRVLKQESDPLLTISRVAPGDQILDCTAGMGSDALVLSMGAGRTGQVTALESSFPVYALLREGMSEYQSGVPEIDEALRRIDVRHTGHLEWLSQLEDRSVDVVYFDPMFRDPLLDSDSIGPLRSYANPDPLSEVSIQQACRVARKTVILKEKRSSAEFRRLGFEAETRGQKKTVYGVINIDSAT